MAVTPGTKLGPYDIVSALGAGGMGEVWRARDNRLGRDVAIKVLHESVAADEERRARFEREARAIATLSHPHILAIFDIGEHDGQLFVVTELLEGVTLRDRLQQGPLPARKAIDWAIQIARGLAAAHEKQLVHRDLKPENIFIGADGRVKILDFGLARQVTAGNGATETAGVLTGAGTVLGTVGYMAPEQVRGMAADQRADLFSFGAVLYEMLTGQRAFRRDTAAETMTAILREEPPDLGQSGADLSPGLDRIVRHCLEKEPQQRFQTAHDVAFALESLSAAGGTELGGQQVVGAGAGVTRRPSRSVVAASVVVAAVAVVWLGLPWLRSPAGSDTSAAPITIGATAQVTAEGGLEIDPVLSPDGRLLAYAAGTSTDMRIYIRPVTGGRTITLSEEGSALEFGPRWSPDGNQILFRTFDGVFVASALGGTGRRVASGATAAAAWAPDGSRILIVRNGALSVVAINGGDVQPLATDSTRDLHSCEWSLRNDWIVCVSGNSPSTIPGVNFGNIAPSAIVLVPVAGGELVNVTDNVSLNVSPVWSPDGGHLYFVSNREGPRDIYVVDVPPDGNIRSEPRRITTGLGLQSVSFSASGDRLAYVTYVARANIWSMPIPTAGVVDTSRAVAVTNSSQVVESIRVSADRQWLLYDSTLHLNADVFRMPISGGAAERMTTDPADEFAPDLSPDGREIAFHSWASGSRDIVVKPLDAGPLQTVTATPAQESYPRWSPDGRAMAFVDQYLNTLNIIQRDAVGTWGQPTELRRDVLVQGEWLDGKTLAYPRNSGLELIPVDGGPSRIVYAPAPGSDDPVVRSVARSDDGQTLYFKSFDAEGESTIWAVSTVGGKPRLLVRFSDPSRPSVRNDFAAGGGQFYFTLEDRQADIWVAEITGR